MSRTAASAEHAAAPAASPGLPLVVESFGLTDRGRVRTQNQDQFLIAELARAMRVQQSSLGQPSTHYGDERGYLFVVADGVGGTDGGERASALAVGTIEEFALNTLRWFLQQDGGGHQVLSEFQAALKQADARILDQAAHHPELRGMGTTVTLAYFFRSALFVIHVGDSRAYLLRAGTLYRLTEDHTLVGELVRRGQLDPVKAARHQLRHVITNVVGGNEQGLRVEMHKLGIEPGDLMLLCSDGLTETVPDDRVAQLLAQHREPRVACKRLVAEANQHGGPDNITVITAVFHAPS